MYFTFFRWFFSDRRRRRFRPLRWEGIEQRVLLAADLGLDIPTADTVALPGDEIAYVFEYSNGGDSDATGVEIRTRLPNNGTFNPASSDPGWNCQLPILPYRSTWCTLSVGTLPAGASGGASFVIDVDAEIPNRVRGIYLFGFIRDNGQAGPDINPRDNFATEKTPINRQRHDLQLNLSDGDVDVSPGGSILYALDYANVGSAVATDASLIMYMPTNTEFDSANSSEGWNCEGRICRLNLGDVAAGESGTADFAVTVDENVRIRRIYSVARIVDGGTGVRDANSFNNIQFERTSIAQPTLDLSISITVATDEISPGETIVYSVAYANHGASDAADVVVGFVLPNMTSFNETESFAGWLCENRNCSVTVGNVVAGSNGTIAIAAAVDSAIPHSTRFVYARANISTGPGGILDANGGNNRAFERTSILHDQPDVSVQISANLDEVQAGGSLLYTLNYGNQGSKNSGSVYVNCSPFEPLAGGCFRQFGRLAVQFWRVPTGTWATRCRGDRLRYVGRNDCCSGQAGRNSTPFRFRSNQ